MGKEKKTPGARLRAIHAAIESPSTGLQMSFFMHSHSSLRSLWALISRPKSGSKTTIFHSLHRDSRAYIDIIYPQLAQWATNKLVPTGTKDEIRNE